MYSNLGLRFCETLPLSIIFSMNYMAAFDVMEADDETDAKHNDWLKYMEK